MKTRKLTVEPHGDPVREKKEAGSMIRLKGRWLRRLGFPPGASVELTAVSPGVLEIRLCVPPRADEQFTTVVAALTEVCREDAQARAVDLREARVSVRLQLPE